MKVKDEYCWAITQAKGRSCCGRWGSGVLKCVFQIDSIVDSQEQQTLELELIKRAAGLRVNLLSVSPW